MSVNEKMTAIANALRTFNTNGLWQRELTLDEMPLAIEDVYDSGMTIGRMHGESEGRENQYKEFWDNILPEGEVLNLEYAFGGKRWNINTFNPPRTIVGSNFFRCFASTALTAINQTIDVTRATSSTALQNMFYNAATVTLSEIAASEASSFDSTTFRGCNKLQNLTITGTIGKNGFDLRYATYISADSVLSILKACKKENAGITITLPTKCIDGKTDTLTYIKANFLEEYERVTGEVYNYNIAFAIE